MGEIEEVYTFALLMYLKFVPEMPLQLERFSNQVNFGYFH